MIVYVITRGEYSSYRICAVATNKAKAEFLARKFNDEWSSARVEEYDTDEYLPILEDKTAFHVEFSESGDVECAYPVMIEEFVPNIRKRRLKGLGGVSVDLWAKDEKSAIKIAAEKRANFLAKKMRI